MDRQGNRMKFDETERVKYAVQQDVSIESARATAQAFKRVGAGLADKAASLADRSSPAAIALGASLTQRAGELAAFATSIEHHCAPEIDADFMRQLDQGA